MIPKVHHAAFRPHKLHKPKVVITINGNHFIPSPHKVKTIDIEGRKYIPVYAAPEHVNKTNSILPTKEGTIHTLKIENKTYIPVDVIPKVFRPLF